MIDVEELLGDLIDPNPCDFDHHGYCQEHGWIEDVRACPQQRITELLAERHAVDIEEHHFGLIHQIRCRPALLDCAVHRALSALKQQPMPEGRYWVEVTDDGGLHFESQ